MKSLKKFAVASMTCAALLGFAATSHAAYQLNDEVKDATPALLMASQIGVKTNVNKITTASMLFCRTNRRHPAHY